MKGFNDVMKFLTTGMLTYFVALSKRNNLRHRLAARPSFLRLRPPGGRAPTPAGRNDDPERRRTPSSTRCWTSRERNCARPGGQ